MTRKLSGAAAPAALLPTVLIGAAGSASAQTAPSTTVPSTSTWLAAVATALNGGTAYLDGKKHAAATHHRPGRR